MFFAIFISFVRGKKPGQGTGFDIKDDDLLEMEQCRELVVASAIFGNHHCSMIVLSILVLKEVSFTPLSMVVMNLSSHYAVPLPRKL